MELSPELKAKRTAVIVKVGAFILLGLVVGPIIGLAIKGLVGLAVAGTIIGAAYFGAPVLAMKAANWRLKALKAEATENPVETLQGEYKARSEALVLGKGKVEKFDATVRTFEGNLRDFKRDFPEDAQQFDDQLSQMKEVLQQLKDDYISARDALKQFAAEIRRAEAFWKMALLAAGAQQDMGLITQDYYAKIKTETALESVKDKLNLTFAKFDATLLDRKTKIQALPQGAQQKLAVAAR